MGVRGDNTAGKAASGSELSEVSSTVSANQHVERIYICRNMHI